jgi:hypothetical protein
MYKDVYFKILKESLAWPGWPTTTDCIYIHRYMSLIWFGEDAIYMCVYLRCLDGGCRILES